MKIGIALFVDNKVSLTFECDNATEALDTYNGLSQGIKDGRLDLQIVGATLIEQGLRKQSFWSKLWQSRHT